jgi:lysophospholipase L1-like esterase
MRRRMAIAVAGVLVAAGCSSTEVDSPGKETYVSLGDSLAVGWQPDDNGGGETTYGYTDVLYRSLYDQDSTLDHVRLGCPGEDTTSMLGGEGLIDEAGLNSECNYAEDSQLEEAEAHLEEHGDDVRLVTIGIGANNLTPCIEVDEEGEGAPEAPDDEDGEEAEDAADEGPGFEVDETCIDEGLDRLRDELPEIAERLRAAAGDDVQIIGMNYYNPFTAAVLTDPPADEDAEEAESEAEEAEEAPGRELAEYGVEVLGEQNDDIARIYAEYDIDLVDVAELFEWDNFEIPEGEDMPTNAAMVCDYTWMCNPNLGPDIHTNDAGAILIAEEFEKLVEAR